MNHFARLFGRRLGENLSESEMVIDRKEQDLDTKERRIDSLRAHYRT